MGGARSTQAGKMDGGTIKKINVPLSSNSPGELKEKIATILDNEDLAVRQGAWSQECITGKFAFQEYIDRNKALRDL